MAENNVTEEGVVTIILRLVVLDFVVVDVVAVVVVVLRVVSLCSSLRSVRPGTIATGICTGRMGETLVEADLAAAGLASLLKSLQH